MSEESTRVELREYIERLLDEREKALVLTAKNLEHRLDSLNALRQEVLSDRERFLSKAAYVEAHCALQKRFDMVEKMQARMVGVGISVMVLTAILSAVLTHILGK
jgi:hypothetical protein